MKRNFLLFVAIYGISVSAYASNGNLMLWYDSPATVWNEALPIGNGRVAAMCFGDPVNDRVQLNEGTFWSGSPSRNDNNKAKGVLEQVRNLIFSNQYSDIENIVNANITAQSNHGQKFLCVGDLNLNFTGQKDYSDYRRELDIEDAIFRTTFKVGEYNYEREYFSSIPDQVIVLHYKTDKPGGITFTASLDGSLKQTTSTPDASTIEMVCKGSSHEGVDGKIMCDTRVKVLATGGRARASANRIMVYNADEVTLLISMATNFKDFLNLTEDEKQKCIDYLEAASTKSYDELKERHIEAYQSFFNRVSLDLGSTDAANLPTDQRIKNFKTANDPQLVTLTFQFGRYLLIASSQPGGQPANLQGIWNDSQWPAWDSKYTININAEMNYWPAEKTNLSELHEPFLRMVADLAEAGQKTAKEMYGCRGWVAHHNTDIWRISGLVDMANSGMWPSGSAWTTQHLWERYIYTGDLEFLKTAYPIMKSACLFYLDFLVKDPRSGYMVVCPSISPENTPYGHSPTSVNGGITMDNQLLFDLFTKTVKAAKLLNIDNDFAQEVENMLDKISPMRIGKYGQLQEWQDDWDNPDDHHRHVSHLYGMFPSNQISPYRNPKLFFAVKKTLTQRGDPSTGWSMGWKINLWARMLDGNHAYKLIKNQLTFVDPVNGGDGGGTYPNMFDAHPPFQIDGNFGFTSGVTEMLMQSHDGCIYLLPALPSNWKTEGSVSGLKAYGGFEVDIKWIDGKVAEAKIKSNLGGNCRIRVPNQLTLVGGDLTPVNYQTPNSNSFFQVPQTKDPIIATGATVGTVRIPDTFLFDFNTEPGKTYIIHDEALAIEDMDADQLQVIDQEFYTLDGRKTKNQPQGLSVIKTTYSKGQNVSNVVFKQ